MRAVLQRLAGGSIAVEDQSGARQIASIERGLLVLLGVKTGDTVNDARALADAVAHLRVFDDDAGKLNLSVIDAGGSVLVVSNFTLYGDCRKGRRPSFAEAAPRVDAEALYRKFGELVACHGIPVHFGAFGARMRVSLVNDGPVTLVLDACGGRVA